MEVSVKVRFESSKERIEAFGNNRYLMYLPFPKDKDSLEIITMMLAKFVGVPASAVEFKCKMPVTNDLVFYVN